MAVVHGGSGSHRDSESHGREHEGGRRRTISTGLFRSNCGRGADCKMKMEYLPDGSVDCPLVRLYEFDQQQAVWLRAVFMSLASSTNKDVSLHDESLVEAVDGCELVLRLGAKSIGVWRKKRLWGKGIHLECTLTSGGWENVASLMEPFCEGDLNGYQWLDENGPVSLLLSPGGRW